MHDFNTIVIKYIVYWRYLNVDYDATWLIGS